VLDGDDRLDVAAHLEVTDDLDPTWLRRGHEVVEDLVDDRLVKSVLVTIVVQVELERPELDDQLIGHVPQVDRRKVGIARAWTEAGKLRAAQFNQVITVGSRIGQWLKPGFGYGDLTVEALKDRFLMHGFNSSPGRPRIGPRRF
jgi:hypothetical protein